MLKVFDKTKEEIAKEEAKRKIYAKMDNKPVEEVCPYYVISKQGQKIDVAELSEDQILSFYTQAINASLVEKGNKEFKDGNSLEEASKLTKALNEFSPYTPSYKGLKTIVELFEHPNPAIKSFSKDLLMPFAGELIKKVDTITTYLLECEGNYEKPTLEEKLIVINQLERNEMNKTNSKTL